MGITGLLPLVKPATTDVKLEKLAGTVAVVDTNGWIHRACYSCGDKVYLNEETDTYINYVVSLCAMLRKHQITPILVFDGQSLPAKAETKAKRQQRKEEVRRKIEAMLRAGDNRGARWLMRQCVDVTFEMVYRVIAKCREEKIDYIVAPFEADAQMAYLVNRGVADYAITEDSDLLVFGCKKVLYKLDRENEKGSMFTMEKLDKCFKNYCEKKFQYMCILSGCDYLANIPNVGLGRARKFFDSLAGAAMSIDFIRQALPKLPSAINMEGKVKVSKEYINAFVRAVKTFDHQLVFCPFTNKLTHLKALRGGLAEHQAQKLGEFAGDFFDDKFDDEFVIHYAHGNVHPKTLEKMDSEFQLMATNKFTWFSEEISARVASKNGIHVSMASSLFVPKSPEKNKVEEGEIKSKVSNSRESKRKVASPMMAEQKSTVMPAKRAKAASNDDMLKPKSPSTQDDVIVSKVEKLSVKSTTTTSTISTKSTPKQGRRLPTRNVFRKSKAEAQALLARNPNGGRSLYFCKREQVQIESEVVLTKPLRTSSPVKKQSAAAAAEKLTDDSDFDDDELEELKLMMKSASSVKEKVDMNISVSSLEDEEKEMLTAMNSTQSSGYASQLIPFNSSQSSPLFSQSSTNKQQSPPTSTSTKPNRNRKSSSTSSTSKRTSSKANNKSGNSPDIRSFFNKRS